MLDTNVSDLEQIELSIEQAKKIIAYTESIERLEKNPDFIKVIQDDYLNSNIIRLVKLKADVSQQTPEAQQHIDNQLNGIAFFNQFIVYAKVASTQAKIALYRDREERMNILAEVN